jgi:hypothetical protein
MQMHCTYLMEHHNGELMLRTSPRHGCCGGTVMLPVLEPGAPQDSAGLDHPRTPGAAHLYRDGRGPFTQRTAAHIGLDRFLKWHKLWIEGLDAQIE